MRQSRCVGNPSEGAEMCHDNPYKSSRYWNLVMIPVDALMMVKRLGLP
jgi:hypothetical protein